MKLVDLIQEIDSIKDVDNELKVFQKGELKIDSEVYLFKDSGLEVEKDGEKYYYLIEIFIVKDFVEEWFINNKGHKEAAQRLFDYAINDA
jgi:hypothetical protein